MHLSVYSFIVCTILHLPQEYLDHGMNICDRSLLQDNHGQMIVKIVGRTKAYQGWYSSYLCRGSTHTHLTICLMCHGLYKTFYKINFLFMVSSFVLDHVYSDWIIIHHGFPQARGCVRPLFIIIYTNKFPNFIHHSHTSYDLHK